MTPEAKARLDEAWNDLIQAKAAADTAIAAGRWKDADWAAQRMRYAASSLEFAIEVIQRELPT